MLALTYQVFAMLCGWLEAILYAERGAESFNFNEHAGMMAQRLAALALAPVAVVLYLWHGSVLLLVAELVPMALLFPLCHDEAYNFTRLWLKWAAFIQESTGSALHKAWLEYRYGYQSPTTTARNDFNGTTRTWLAVAGGVGLAAIYGFAFHLFSF